MSWQCLYILHMMYLFQIITIVSDHGVVVITREGTNPAKFIYESDILTKYQVSFLLCIIYYCYYHLEHKTSTNHFHGSVFFDSLILWFISELLQPSLTLKYHPPHSLFICFSCDMYLQLVEMCIRDRSRTFSTPPVQCGSCASFK